MANFGILRCVALAAVVMLTGACGTTTVHSGAGETADSSLTVSSDVTGDVEQVSEEVYDPTIPVPPEDMGVEETLAPMDMPLGAPATAKAPEAGRGAAWLRVVSQGQELPHCVGSWNPSGRPIGTAFTSDGRPALNAPAGTYAVSLSCPNKGGSGEPVEVPEVSITLVGGALYEWTLDESGRVVSRKLLAGSPA